MLLETIDRLLDAVDKEGQEKVLRELEKAGMDRATALFLAMHRKKEREAVG